jgi:uncharacterized protein (TIGR03382 family)
MLRLAVPLAVILFASGTAHALKPGKHADITKKSCQAAGLPRDFCQRAATEDYDTDSREWDDLRAHAQISDGQTACEAADATAGRLYGLGQELRGAIASLAVHATEDRAGKVGAALGRALHTIQDNCAHHGMPNPQHAWFSMSDFCDGTSLSPDIQDDAIACARHETDAVMSEVARAIKQAGISGRLSSYSCPEDHDRHDNQQTPVCQRRFLPGPFAACGFLSRAGDWDGVDRQWENSVATVAFRDAFLAGLAGGESPSGTCGGDESVLSQAVSEPVVDVSVGKPQCFKADLFCLGKADDGDNPFADDLEADDAGGCSTGGAAGAPMMLFAALLLLRRRRR